MPEARESGKIRIRGQTWRWGTVSTCGGRRSRRGGGREGILVAFRDPEDPGREMRCVLSRAGDDELTEEKLREAFRRAWAVSP